MLAWRSYHVLTADSSVTALNVLDCNPQVDLVISEAVLPGGSGSELIGIVKQLFPSAAVMFTTAYTEESLDPAIFCLQKPFTIGTLMNRVEKFCREPTKYGPQSQLCFWRKMTRHFVLPLKDCHISIAGRQSQPQPPAGPYTPAKIRSRSCRIQQPPVDVVFDMSDDAEAARAIAALNGKDVQGRTLTVNEARPKTDRPGGGGFGRKQR